MNTINEYELDVNDVHFKPSHIKLKRHVPLFSPERYNLGISEGKISKNISYGLSYLPNGKCEDRFAISSAIFGNDEEEVRTLLFSIFDGHGGFEASTYCSENLHEVFLSKMKTELKLESIHGASLHGYEDSKNPSMKALMAETDDSSDILKPRNPTTLFDSINNETTSLFNLSFKEMDEIIVQQTNAGTTAIANTGDSRALIICDDQLVLSTIDHNPMNISEAERCFKDASDFYFGKLVSEDGYKHSALKIINPHTHNCLSVTRSIGTKLASKACIPNPDVFEYIVNDSANLVRIILASDGLWEIISTEKVVNFVNGFSCPDKASVALSNKARLKRLTEGKRMDDISVLIVDIKIKSFFNKNSGCCIIS